MDNKIILVIDDNLTNLKLIKVVLELKGYEVLTAMKAEEALDLLFDVMPALILMDIQLPGINGLELTQKLKADNRYKSIPIVAITAYAMKGDKEKALASGCDGYITKPMDIAAFPDVIAQYLGVTQPEYS